jgi:hypothetical protein
MSEAKPTRDEARADSELRRANASLLVLTILGIWLLASVVFPDALGWTALASKTGGDATLVRFFLGFLFLYSVGLIRDKERLRITLDRMMEIVNCELYGADYREMRRAVDVMIGALKSGSADTKAKARAGLKNLTGTDFGEDFEKWLEWWRTARSSFGSKRRGGGSQPAR